MGNGRSKRRVEIAALVTDRQLQYVAFVSMKHLLDGTDEVAQVRLSAGVVVVVNATEADEHRHRGAKLGEELTGPTEKAIGNRRQQPRPQHIIAQRGVVECRPWVGHDKVTKRAYHRKSFIGVGVGSPYQGLNVERTVNGTGGIEHERG